MLLVQRDASSIIETWPGGIVLAGYSQCHFNSLKDERVSCGFLLEGEPAEFRPALGVENQTADVSGAPSRAALKGITIFRQRLAYLERADQQGCEIVGLAEMIGHYRNLVSKIEREFAESGETASGTTP